MKKNYLVAALLAAATTATAQKPVDVPYEQTFDTESTLSAFITINANNDDNTWDYNPMLHCARCIGCATGPVDDYLLLPINLEAYASYEVEFHCYGGYFAETFDLWLADAPTVEGMKTQLLAPRDVTFSSDNTVHRASFSVEQSGVYYIAWHAMSGVDLGALFLDDIRIKGTASACPAAPEMVAVVPGEKGKRVCDLTFKLPTTTLVGGALKSVSAARIYRNDNLVATLRQDSDGQPLAPGSTCYYHDAELSNRLYTYKVVAVGAEGEESAPATTEVYVGLDTPGRISNLRLREDINRPGRVVMTWDAPTEGVHGGYIDPKGISYVVSKSYDDEPVVYDTRFEEDINISRGQTSVAYSVYAQNAVGDNRSNWQTISTQVGPAVPTPWGESFPGSSCKNGPWLTHVTADSEIGEASWYISSPVGPIPDQDGDGGYTYFFTVNTGKSARFTSPKIDISNLTSPALTFWLYEHGNADLVEVDIMPDMSEWTTLKTITLDGPTGWRRHVIDLSDYRDAQFIQVGFNGISVETTTSITAVDNISIHNEAERDLAILKHDFPARVNIGEPNDFKVTFRNRGSRALTAGSYRLELYRHDAAVEGDRLACSVDGRAIDTDEMQEVTLTDKPDVFTSDAISYSVRLVLDGDATPADNVVEPEAAVVFKPVYPVPTMLRGEGHDAVLDLAWTTPDVGEGSALPVTDSFEDYPIFSIDDCGEWTLFDADKQRTTIMALSSGATVSVLDYENAGEPMAWQVFSPIDAGIPYTSWDPHSGELMVVAMSNSKNEADGSYHDNDDWLISPQLSGRAQRVSFFAKCGMGAAYQPELLEVLYSTTDADPASFQPVLDAPIELYNVSSWEEHIVDIPDGAKYFALRCVSQHKFALLLDDVTYQPHGKADLTLLGYNVYCNRELLNATPLPTPYFTVADLAADTRYEFCVTALYDRGESLPSESFVTISNVPEGIIALPASRLSFPAYDLQGRPAGQSTKGIVVSPKRGMLRL